ncbi:uncharacterized protein LOC142987892 isoform X2 [Anticarsia gemmatalis]|uniref:uncharacterized protein LOC142987892 isoform X2 n=1 Tax=Anticarsia gemmatalis TaxID=129554 RepID=UPI003F773A09
MMEKRMEELSKLRSYTDEIDKELTMILQSLQWDRKHILQHPAMSTCTYESNHCIPQDKLKEHEEQCLLRQHGYVKEDLLLPEPLDINCNTVIKLSKEDITKIIDNAAKLDPTFKRGVGSGGLEPQSAGRLQASYSQDERRAIHDAVVSASPSCHTLTDLALPSVDNDGQAPKVKSRTEILAELRDMRRRRTKYRVAAKSTKYSDVLRDVIKTQMELYNEAIGATDTNVNDPDTTAHEQTNIQNDNTNSRGDDRHRLLDRQDNRARDYINKDRETKRSRYNDYRNNYPRERRDYDKQRNVERRNEREELDRKRSGRIHREETKERHDDRSHRGSLRNYEIKIEKPDDHYEDTSNYEIDKRREYSDDRRDRSRDGGDSHERSRRYERDRSDERRKRYSDRRDVEDRRHHPDNHRHHSDDRRSHSNDPREYSSDRRKRSGDRRNYSNDRRSPEDRSNYSSDRRHYSDRRHHIDKRKRSRRDRDRSTDRQDHSDTERAQNLIMEIKRELDVKSEPDDDNEYDNAGSMEISHDRHYRDYVSRGGRHEHDDYERKYHSGSDDNGEKHKHRKRNDSDSSEEATGGRRHKKSKHKKDKRSRKDRHRCDRRYSEEKHRSYDDTYPEIKQEKI